MFKGRFSSLRGQMLGALLMLFVVFGFYRCGVSEHELVLLHTNDSHGSVLSVDSLGGMAERATFVRMIRDKYAGVLLVDAGDLNTGQAISNMFDAHPDIEAYNYMGYDAVTVGNHEFDKPVTTLLQQMQWAHFPFVVSNIDYEGKELGVKYLIKQVNGVKVGIFGLTTKNTENVSVHAKEVRFYDEVKTAREMVRLLQDQKVDVIIGLVHLGFTKSTPDFVTSCVLADSVSGVDILVDGHSHSYIEEPVRVNNTWIVTANQSGRYVGKGILKVKDGRLVDFHWEPVQIKGFRPDTVLVNRLQPYIEASNKDLMTVIGEASAEYALFENGVNMARFKEVALGDLVADALTWKAQELGLQADFGLTNSGGIRDGLPAGKLTKGDVLAVLPFGNELEVVAMKGSDVRRLFDFLATVVPGNGAFAQVSAEVEVVYDAAGRKVKSLKIKGQPVQDDQVYYMATCDYVAAGKDGYDAGLGGITSREKTSRLMSDVLMEYIRARGVVTPRTEGRIRTLND